MRKRTADEICDLILLPIVLVGIAAGIYFIILAGTFEAYGHDWYPRECCGGHDCHPVNCAELYPREDKGFTWGQHQFRAEATRRSPDGACHVCVQRLYPFMVPRCVFVPGVDS